MKGIEIVIGHFEYETGDGCSIVGQVDGDGPLLIMLHGGGPDHHSMRPLAQRLWERNRVALPDIRGYGSSVCIHPSMHTWDRYVTDVIQLMDSLGAQQADFVGAGLGATIVLRTCLAHSHRVRSAVVISVEDIEDDDAKAAEMQLMDHFAARVRQRGIAAGWELFLPQLQPLIAELVQEAMPRANPESVAAAAAIGHDRAFRNVDDIACITAPILVIAGDDLRHPAGLARQLAELMPNAQLAEAVMSRSLLNAEDMAEAFAPEIRAFLAAIRE